MRMSLLNCRWGFVIHGEGTEGWKMLMLHSTYSTIQTEGQIEEALLLDGAATTRELNDCGEMFIVAVH